MVPQDRDNSVKTTLATCPALCDNNPAGQRDAIVEFTVNNLPANAADRRITLRLYAWRSSEARITVKPADGGANSTGKWTERPKLGSAVATHATVARGFNNFDVSDVVDRNGTYTFALQQEQLHTRVYFASRENRRAEIRPALIIADESGARPTTGPRPTATATQPGVDPSPSTSSPSPTSSPQPSRTATPEPTTPAGWRLAWRDEFDGNSIDRTKWNARDNTYVDYDKACITDRPENISVGNGVATLTARQESFQCGSERREFTVSYLDTIGKASFTYGRFEVRAKSPNGANNSAGLWPAFWARPNDGGNGEFDVVELPGGDRYYKAATQAIFRDYKPTKQDHRWTFPAGDPSDGFHTYAVEWEPGVMRWLIDNRVVWERSRGTTPWFDEVFSKPYHLRMNFQVGGWLGNPDPQTAFPAKFVVDYVRVYQR